MTSSTARGLPKYAATSAKLIQDESEKRHLYSPQPHSTVDLSPYIHSSVFDVLQPTKNLKIKVCSFKNLETIEDDVYEKLLSQDKQLKQRHSSLPQHLPSSSTRRSRKTLINPQYSQSNKGDRILNNRVNPQSKLSINEKSLLSDGSGTEMANLKQRNIRDSHTMLQTKSLNSGLQKGLKKQSTILVPQEEDILIQLNLPSKKGLSSNSLKNIQFLALKKDQFQKTLNYLETLNQMEQQQKSKRIIKEEEEESREIKLTSKNCLIPNQQSQLDQSNQIKSFANLPEVQTRAEILTKNFLPSQDPSQIKNNNITNINNSTQNTVLHSITTTNNNNKHVTNNLINHQTPSSYSITTQPFNRSNLTPLNTKLNSQQIYQQINTPLKDQTPQQLSESKYSSQTHSRVSSQILESSHIKQSPFKWQSNKKLQIPQKLTLNSKLQSQQTLQMEDSHHQNSHHVNVSTLDQIDQVEQPSNDKAEKYNENTEPLPTRVSRQQTDMVLQKQQTMGMRNEGQRRQQISLLNLQDVCSFNKDPLSSRKTADSTPFDIKPVQSMEAHLSAFRAKVEMQSPLSTNINSRAGGESEDRKSLMNEQINAMIQKKLTYNEKDGTQSTLKDIQLRQISPFTIHRQGTKRILSKDFENLSQAKGEQKKENEIQYRFESPLRSQNTHLLNNLDGKNINPLTQSNQELRKLRGSKAASQDFGSTLKRLSSKKIDFEGINQKSSAMNSSQLMNTSQLSSAQLSTFNTGQKTNELLSPLKAQQNLNTIFTSQNSEGEITEQAKRRKKSKKLDPKNLEPMSQFIQQVYQMEFTDNIEVPQSIQYLNNNGGDIFQNPKFQELSEHQNEIFNKFINQAPYVQGKLKCGLADYIKQQKNKEMNRLKTYYKFGFSTANKDEKSQQLQNVLDSIVPRNEIGSIQCSDLWNDKHIKIIHDRANFSTEKSFIQQYLAYKSRNPAKNYHLTVKKPPLDMEKIYSQYEKDKKKQNLLNSKCQTERKRESNIIENLNNSLNSHNHQKSVSTLHPSCTSTKRINTKSSSMTQQNFKKSLQLRPLSKEDDLRREKILFKDLINFTERVLKNNNKDIETYNQIQKFEDEDQD